MCLRSFNLIVSNVPGPDFPLYLAGARMVAMYPVGPIVEGVGVNVTVFSYLDTMYVGVQACWDLAPDIDAIARGMEESLDELIEWPTGGTGRFRGGTPNCLRNHGVARVRPAVSTAGRRPLRTGSGGGPPGGDEGNC